MKVDVFLDMAQFVASLKIGSRPLDACRHLLQQLRRDPGGTHRMHLQQRAHVV